ncbi:MAG: STAS domain-containing protein [Candidatus Omnitrophota bacterium]|nr:STAS domain-containing protein [Candidatus Omnitrophota bacterium]
MPLTVRTLIQNPNTYVLYPIGTIDSDTSPILEKAITAALSSKPKNVVLDLEKTTYLTSLGISVIINANKELEKNGGALILINVPASIKKVFEIIKALPAQSIFSSREELDAYLLKMQQKNGAHPGF